MKYQPIYEHMDNRGMSVRYAEMRDNRKKARRDAAKKMGKSYFTNPNSSLDSNHEYNHGNRRPGIFNIQANGS